MKTLLLAFFLSSAGFLSCNSARSAADSGETAKKASETPDEGRATYQRVQAELLVGEWVWLKTDCCGRTSKTTYAEDDRKKIAFFEDRTAEYFAGPDREKTTRQEISFGSLGEKQPTVKIGDLTPAIFAVQNDTLILSWGYIDLQIEYYGRVK